MKINKGDDMRMGEQMEQKKLGNYAILGNDKSLKVELRVKGLKEYEAKLNEVLKIIKHLEENIEQLNKIKLEIEF